MAIREGANEAAAARYENAGGGGQQAGGQVQADFGGPAPSQPQQEQALQQQSYSSPVESMVSQAMDSSSLPATQQRQQQRNEQPAQRQQREAVSSGPASFMPPARTTAGPIAEATAISPQASAASQSQAQGGSGYEQQSAPSQVVQQDANSMAYMSSQPSVQERRPEQQGKPSKPKTDSERLDEESTNPAVVERRQQYQESQARADIRQTGIVEKPAPMNLRSNASRRFTKAKNFVRTKIKDTVLHGKSYSGTSFYETIYSDATIWPHEVSIGTENLRESLREPNSQLLEIINEVTGAELTAEECLLNIEQLVDAINENHIEVVLEKTPVNVRNSVQVRTVVVRRGRGIGLHPSQTKAYNADFDGDPAFLNFDQTNLDKFPRAMTQLIDIEGNPTIDPDFFPIEPLDQGRDLCLQCMEDYGFGKEVANDLVDYYIAFSNVKSGSELNKCWIDLLRALDNSTSKAGRMLPGESREEFLSRNLKLLYDFSVDRRGLSIKTQTREFVEHSNYQSKDLIPKGADPFVWRLVDIVDEIVAGRAPMNFEDFTSYYNKYYGDIGKEGERKNVPFRLLADFAKAINRTDLISIGSDFGGIKVVKRNGKEVGIAEAEPDDTVSLHDLWQFTSAAAVSKLISGRMHMGSHELVVSTQVKTRVLKNVGLPPIPTPDMSAEQIEEQYREWIDKFVRSYNSNMRMLNIAQVWFRGGMMPIRGNVNQFDGIDDSLENIAEALVKVYGDFTVERMFPMLGFDYAGGRKENSDFSMVAKYRAMPLNRFMMENRFSFLNEDVEEPVFDSNGKPIMRSDGLQVTRRKSVPKFEAVDERLSNRDFYPMDVLLKVADRRSSQLGHYREKWEEATKANCDNLTKILKDIADDKFNRYVNDMLEMMYLMSPRMFSFFGMDSPLTFAKSKWGKRLLADSGNVEMFRSHLVSMTIEYRLNKASKMLTEMKEANDTIGPINEAGMARIEKLDAAYENEMEVLASSSMVWSAIVHDMTSGVEHSTFKYLVDGKGSHHKSGGQSWDMYAADFWKGEECQKYGNLLSFLKSSAPYQTKMAVLADVTRVNQQYEYMSMNEVIGQLAHNPDPLHSGSRFEMDSGVSSEIDAIKESINRISSYQSRSPEKILKESNRILDDAMEDKQAFENMLYRFATDPGYYVHVDTILAADAVASVFDKTYDDSEKIKQQSTVNGYFGAISYQKSGGYFTHLYKTDNGVVNMVGFDQLSSFDMVRILGNPDFELHVYDEFGCPAVLSRETLCGGNTIDDVIKYLREHPRVTLSCRRHMVGIKDDVNGSARLNAMKSNTIGDTTVNRVFSLFNDRPRFLAIAALATPSSGRTGRNLAESINENLENICSFVAIQSTEDKEIEQRITDIENFLGLKVSIVDEYSNLDPEATQNLYVEVVTELLDCIDTVQREGTRIVLSELPDLHSMSIDESSIISYYDARQQISGARTATMIGIEGSETKKNLVLKEYLRHHADRFMTVGVDTPRSEILKLSELTESNLDAEIEASDDGTIVIEVPQGWNPADETLERNPRKQIGSIAKFLEVKREKGAETFNAKAKKYGDDGKNSMLKFVKYTDETIAEGAKLRRQIEASGSKDAAIPMLAKALIDADAELGYIDIGTTFTKSDYYNRADLMLVEEETDDGLGGTKVVVRIRTLEQLSVALRSRLSDEALMSEDNDVVYGELEQIVGMVGTSGDIMHPGDPDVVGRCSEGVPIHSSIGNRYRVDRALRQRSSSVERNYNLIFQIVQSINRKRAAANKAAYVIPPRERTVERSNRQFRKLPMQLQKKLKGIAFPKDKYNEEESAMMTDMYGDRKWVYDYLGEGSDPETVPVPGPQSMVLFRNMPNSGTAANMFDMCREMGMTAAFDDMKNVPSKYHDDIIDIGDGLYILPFFDMMLNGCVSDPIVPAPSVIPINPDNVTVCVEDTTYEIKPGDATAHITSALGNRTRVNFSGTEVFDAYDLFPTVLNDNESDFQVQPCNREEIERYIVHKLEPCTIDYGVLEGSPDYAREVERYKIREREYIEKFESANDESIIEEADCRYDSIVGYVKIIRNDHDVVFAPIVPFHMQKSGKVPTTYRIDSNGFEYDPDTNSFNLNWRYSGSLLGQYIKFFEGIGASNKMMAFGSYIRDRKLQNGLPVDLMYSTKSVASRLFASNKRINTMISMMMIPRIDPKYGYNFGMLDGAFPGNPEYAEKLSAGDMKIGDWREIVESQPDFRWHSDNEINGIVDKLVKKCVDPETGYQTVNPSILLSTKTKDGMIWPMVTEFEAFLETGYNFQNALMKLMNAMNPTLCPPSIDADSSNCLFKPVTDLSAGYDYGVLQMLVPHYDADGEEYLVPENVYLSFGFFGEEFSGFKKVNIDGFNRSIDSLNVSSNMNGFELSQVMAFGRADYSSVLKMSSNIVEAVPDAIMIDKEKEDGGTSNDVNYAGEVEDSKAGE